MKRAARLLAVWFLLSVITGPFVGRAMALGAEED